MVPRAHRQQRPLRDPRRTPNLYLDGTGNLVLKAHPQRPALELRPPEHHAQQAFPLLSGRVEARIRLEPGAGFWPSFWLLGEDHDTVNWPTCGEQDIMEWVQKYGPGTTSSTIHGPGYSGAHGIGSQFAFPNGARIDDGAFHTYGMTWSPNRMEFYRDDPAKPYFVVTPASLPPGQKWVYDDPFYVILNFAVGESGFPGSTDSTTPHTGSMWGRLRPLLSAEMIGAAHKRRDLKIELNFPRAIHHVRIHVVKQSLRPRKGSLSAIPRFTAISLAPSASSNSHGPKYIVLPSHFPPFRSIANTCADLAADAKGAVFHFQFLARLTRF